MLMSFIGASGSWDLTDRAQVRELRAAVALEPEHESARRELHRLLGMLN